MAHATVHETEYQVTIQAVFRKPENLSSSSLSMDRTKKYRPIDSERSSIFTNTFYSDGRFLFFNILFKKLLLLFCFCLDEYTKEKMPRRKIKSRTTDRPSSANSTNIDRVRRDILS